MSSNNQTLILKENGKYYVFRNVMAESWDGVCTLEKESAFIVWDNFEDIYLQSCKIDNSDGTEYWVSCDNLAKDWEKVFLKS